MDEFAQIEDYGVLYKRGVKGEVRAWRMQLGCEADDADKNRAGHRVVSGIVGGAETPSGWTHCEPKNVGRSNETTSYTQALAEIAAEYQKKRDRGYFDNIEDIDDVPFTKPMLAQDWTKRKDKVKLSGGVYLQPKLDGIRCIARADGLWTRTGKRITSCGHIERALESVFDGNPDLILDGELYNHALRDDFNSITSIVRKAKPTEEDAVKAEELIEYHIYDIISDGRFRDRWAALERIFSENRLPLCLVRVQTKFALDEKILDMLYARWMEDGYEGQMVRLDAPYENKRSNALMKRKDFETAEFKVEDVHEGDGNWAGAVKRFSLRDNQSDAVFGAGVRGKYDDLRDLLESGDKPVWATLRFFARTPDGIPRFPVVIDYGFEDERED